jgi:ABC-type antimicrobial peptide transport system permease subunit
MAVRLSIGGARRHLIGQLLGESVLLAGFGGAFGVLVAKWTMAAVVAMLPPDAAEAMTFAIDFRVLMFMAVVTVATGLLFGIFPALHSTRPNLAVALKGQAGQPVAPAQPSASAPRWQPSRSFSRWRSSPSRACSSRA